MTCEQAQLALADRLAGVPQPELDTHLLECAACQAEAASIEAAWVRMGMLETPPPAPARMRTRFYDALARERRPVQWGWVAAAACLVVGLGVGYLAGRPSREQQELAAVRAELAGMRQMVAMNLLQNPSAADRLRGVSYTMTSQQSSDPEVTRVLLDRLSHDPNTNVRLAVVDALEKHARDREVRQGLLAAVDDQRSPLVQLALIDLLSGMRGDRSALDALRRLAATPEADASVRLRATRVLQTLEAQ
jgi:hypothetical protein